MMDECGTNDTYIILDESSQEAIDPDNNCITTINADPKPNEHFEKHSAVWTANATSTLLKLYEKKLEMLETPKKKTRIWIAISDNLKDYNINMTADQVRWKVNALTKKYKKCIDNGYHSKFKYFKEMDSIYAQYNVDYDSYINTEFSHKNNAHKLNTGKGAGMKPSQESKSMIELRKIRLANRIESDRTQGKINLEKQWLEYLRKQDIHKECRGEIHDRTLKLREEELELRKRHLEFTEKLECKIIQSMEKYENNILVIEREKCELMNLLFSNKDENNTH